MSSSKFSYQRLTKEDHQQEENEVMDIEEGSRKEQGRVHHRVVLGSSRRRWVRLRRRRWGRLRRIRISGIKRAVRAAVRKVVKRLKEGKPYIGDLFAGNYMFMQVSPASLGRSYLHAAAGPHFYSAAAVASALPRISLQPTRVVS